MNTDRVASQEYRVVHLTTVHQPFDPRIFYKQLGSLRDAGFDTHLIVPHAHSETREGIDIHALPEPKNRAHRFALQLRVYRMARALDADLYQVHDPELLPLGGLLKARTGARLVYDMHENYRAKGPLVGRTLRALERWGFRGGDHVLLAEESYRSIVEGHAVPRTYLPNYFRPIGGEAPGAVSPERKSPPTRLLYTGTLSESRGLRTMVELAARIRRSDRPETLELVGVCRFEDQRTWAEERIHAERLDGVVERVGWDRYVPPSRMSAHYREADVGLALFEPHPNYRDTLPTKFYEYLHYGLPLICSDVPRWRQFVDRHDCGAVVPPGDPEAVLDVLDEWRAHPERYAECAQNARGAAAQYRWEPVGERLIAVYRDLLEENGD